jgi:hypothetical protein
MGASERKRSALIWLGVGVGVAAGVYYLLRHNDAAHRMDRLIRRCEDRIHGIEDSLTSLETSLGSS